jgi:NAD(P)-dependent dehydrogenase (short-subunit alcohol dehydrogenase family)
VKAITKSGGEAIANSDDISDWNGAKNLIDAAVERFGRLDVLVNNAGILRDRMLVNMSEQEWDDVIRVHLKGTFAPAHHAAAYWKEISKTSGKSVNARLINTSSTSGLFGNIGQVNYGAAKAGIASFSIIAARELARIGVTVNVITPTAHTRLSEGLRVLDEQQRETRDPKWIAPVVVFLSSEHASDITGRVFQVGNGVLSVMEGWHRGPQRDPVLNPAELGPILREMITRARKNAGMDSLDLD